MKNEGTILAERKAQAILGILNCGANSGQWVDLVDVLEKLYYDGYDMGWVANNKHSDIEEVEELKKEAEAQDFLKQILVKDLEIMEQEIKILDAKIDDVKLERDALWVKTQEDEREINDLRDINKQLREKLDNLILEQLTELAQEL
jgi:hypothetical protein